MFPDTATNFLYDNEKLSDHGMVLCSFDSGGLETVSAGNSLTFGTVKTGASDKSYFGTAGYEEPLSATFQICKYDYRYGNESISAEELTSLLRWLARRDGFHRFQLYQKGYEGVYFYGSFNDIKLLKLGGVLYGLELTLVTDSPYGYENISFDLTARASVGSSVFCLSNETGYIYPKVFTCKCLEAGNLRLHNSVEDRVTEIKNCVKGEIISLDGNRKIIESSSVTHKLYNDFNYNFFRLGSRYDDNLNIITASLPCEIHIEYESIRKVGLG